MFGETTVQNPVNSGIAPSSQRERAIEIPASQLVNEMNNAKIAGTLRGIGGGSSFGAFDKIIPLDESAMGTFIPTGKVFKRTNKETGEVTFYVAGKATLGTKTAVGRMSLNGMYDAATASLVSSEPEKILPALQAGATSGLRAYFEHRQFDGDRGKVTFIPAYPVV